MELTARDNLKLAVGAILLACLALSLGDALIKQQSASFVIWQIFVMRSVIVIPFLVYFVRIRSCEVSIRPGRARWTLLRSLILVLMWILYFAALPRIELATAAAAYYTSPLFITLFAALFLGQRITANGWLAVLLGFIGSLLILQPQAGDFDAWALLPIAAAICYACAMILTRSKCRHEKPTVLALWLNVAFAVVGAVALLLLQLWNPDSETIQLNPFLLGQWKAMWLDEWRVMAILAMAILVGSVGAAFAYQNALAPTVATFDFAYVAFAVIWGFLLFGEMPQPLIASGIAIIVAAGILAVRQKANQWNLNHPL